MHEMKYEHSADATVILACSHESVEQPLQQEEQDLAPSIFRGCHKQAIGAGWQAHWCLQELHEASFHVLLSGIPILF